MHITTVRIEGIEEGSEVQPHLSILCDHLTEFTEVSNTLSPDAAFPRPHLPLWEIGSKADDVQIWQTGVWILALQLIDVRLGKLFNLSWPQLFTYWLKLSSNTNF